MEFNDYNRNQNNSQPKSFGLFSPYRFNNPDSTIDPTSLTFGFWKRCLKIGVCPRKNTGNPDDISFDMDNGIFVFLSHTKARIFANEIRKFIEGPDVNDGAGVPTNQGLITIHNGKSFGSEYPVIVVRKINEKGETTAAFAYQTKSDYYYSIRNYTEDGSFNKITEDYKNIELQMILTMLDEYVKAMTYAVTYTVIDQMSFQTNRLSEKLDAIMQATGAQMKQRSNQNYNNGGYSSASVFNRANSGMNMGTPGTDGFDTGGAEYSIDDIG